MSDYINLPIRNEAGDFNVVVEAPRGSLVKLKYEPKMKVFVFHRPLPLGVAYPYDWGFFPSTRSEDGDPLDAMVMFDAPTWPGVVIASRVIGVVRLLQRDKGKGPKTRNDRIIAVPAQDERYDDVGSLPKRVREELETFFITTSSMSKNTVEVEGWEGPKAGRRLIEKAAMHYLRKGP